MLKRKIFFVILICLVSFFISFLVVSCNVHRKEVAFVEINKSINFKLKDQEKFSEDSELFSGKSNFEHVNSKSIKFNFRIEKERLVKISLDNKVKEGSIQVELYDSNNEVYLNIIKKEFKEELYFKLFKGKYILKISVKDGKDGYSNFKVSNF